MHRFLRLRLHVQEGQQPRREEGVRLTFNSTAVPASGCLKQTPLHKQDKNPNVEPRIEASMEASEASIEASTDSEVGVLERYPGCGERNGCLHLEPLVSPRPRKPLGKRGFLGR